MIPKLSRYFLIILATVVLSQVMPAIYDNLFDVRINTPYVSFGAEKKVFFIYTREEGKGPAFTDSKGEKYTRNRYLDATPSENYFYHIKNGTMPDSINGVKVDARLLQRESFNQMTFPFEFSQPEYKLYPLLESAPEAELTWPKDFFRIDKRIEFIDAKTNHIDEEKSVTYTGLMKKEGFVFPATLVAGMPTVMKQWDDGWFLTDKEGSLFHLKMVKGEPYFVKISKPDNIKIKKMVCNSYSSREFYATLVSDDNRIYLLRSGDYKLLELPINDYNPDTQALQIAGSLFYKTVILNGEGSIKAYAIDRKYNKVAEYAQTWPVKADMAVGKVFTWLFPFSIEMQPASSHFVHFQVNRNHTGRWIYLNLLLLALSFLLIKRQGRKLSSNILDLIIVAVTGIFGFIAVNIFANKEY
jgi:hypothetical protein